MQVFTDMLNLNCIRLYFECPLACVFFHVQALSLSLATGLYTACTYKSRAHNIILLLKLSYIRVLRAVVSSTTGELVVAHSDDVIAKELVEYCAECASVPVISDTPTVVTLTSEVLQSSKWHLL